MDYAIAMYSSITVANRVKKLAANQISYLGIIQAPASLGVKGCNYSIRCKFEDLETLRAICDKFGLKIKAVFKETIQNGEKVYIRL